MYAVCARFLHNFTHSHADYFTKFLSNSHSNTAPLSISKRCANIADCFANHCAYTYTYNSPNSRGNYDISLCLPWAKLQRIEGVPSVEAHHAHCNNRRVRPGDYGLRSG